MEKTQVLIPGGYGAVGTIISTLLSKKDHIMPVVAGRNEDHFDKIDSADIFFTSGGNMDTLTPLALQGISHMMRVTPMQWENESWIKAPAKGRKEYISEPFNKQITFYPYMVTHDLVELPKIVKTGKIVMWSMSESFFMGMVLLMGLKMGLAKTIKKAEKFLSILRFLGKKNHRDYSLKIVSKGRKENLSYQRVVEMNETEEFLTAIVPTIVCEQIANGDISRVGAFTGAEIVDIQKFIDSLKNAGINYKDVTKKI